MAIGLYASLGIGPKRYPYYKFKNIKSKPKSKNGKKKHKSGEKKPKQKCPYCY